MKFSKISVGILVVLCRKELDSVGILHQMKKINGRDISSSAFITSVTQLLKTELISVRSDDSAVIGTPVKYYSITQAGHEILKSIKTGLLKRGKVG